MRLCDLPGQIFFDKRRPAPVGCWPAVRIGIRAKRSIQKRLPSERKPMTRKIAMVVLTLASLSFFANAALAFGDCAGKSSQGPIKTITQSTPADKTTG